MKMRFLGPLHTVAGSCTYLEDERLGVKLLVDCGSGNEYGPPPYCRGFPFDPEEIDFVLLTHAHRDHCGLLPKLADEGFSGRVICTRETAELAARVLRDEAGGDKLDFHHLQPGAGGRAKVAPGLWVECYPSGHILGAVSFRILWGGPRGCRSVIFSGDLGQPEPRRSFSLLRPPHRPPVSDFVVMESTYGGRRHPAIHHLTGLMGDLAVLVDRASRLRGALLIPAFALERMQLLLFVLQELARSDPSMRGVAFRFDSPTARDLCRVYADALGPQGDRGSFWLAPAAVRQLGLDPNYEAQRRAAEEYCRWVFDPVASLPPQAVMSSLDEGDDLRHLLSEQLCDYLGPHVAVCSGGMLNNGTIRKALEARLRQPTTTIALTGYAAPGTLGWQLRHLTAGDRVLEVTDGIPVPLDEIRAGVENLAGYSGHADHDGLIWWASHGYWLATKRIFLTHGDDRARSQLELGLERARGNRRHPEIVIPADPHGWFDLDGDRWLKSDSNGSHSCRDRQLDLDEARERWSLIAQAAAAVGAAMREPSDHNIRRMHRSIDAVRALRPVEVHDAILKRVAAEHPIPESDFRWLAVFLALPTNRPHAAAAA